MRVSEFLWILGVPFSKGVAGCEKGIGRRQSSRVPAGKIANTCYGG